MRRLKVACVGAGYFGQFHYDSWARLDGVDLAASCDRNIEAAQRTGLPAYSDLDKMIEDVRPDVLDIIVPPVAHAQVIRTALDKGVKTLICQKPFCQSHAEAEQMTALAERCGAVLIVHENFRFQPWYRALKTQLNRSAVGTLQQVTFRLRPGDGQGPHAYLERQPYFQKMNRFLVHETAVHWVDTFRFLLGNPTAVYADLRQVNPAISGEDAGYILFDHPGGVRALFDGNRHLDHASDNPRRTMGEAVIEGTTGTITLRGDGSLWRRGFQEQRETCLLGADTWDGFGGDCVHRLQTHVVSGLLNGTPLENTARDYLRVIDIEEAIYASADTGQKIKLDP